MTKVLALAAALTILVSAPVAAALTIPLTIGGHIRATSRYAYAAFGAAPFARVTIDGVHGAEYFGCISGAGLIGLTTQAAFKVIPRRDRGLRWIELARFPGSPSLANTTLAVVNATGPARLPREVTAPYYEWLFGLCTTVWLPSANPNAWSVEIDTSWNGGLPGVVAKTR